MALSLLSYKTNIPYVDSEVAIDNQIASLLLCFIQDIRECLLHTLGGSLPIVCPDYITTIENRTTILIYMCPRFMVECRLRLLRLHVISGNKHLHFLLLVSHYIHKGTVVINAMSFVRNSKYHLAKRICPTLQKSLKDS